MECTKGREQAVLLPGDCLTGEAHLAGPSTSADEPTPHLRHRDGTRVSAPPLVTDPVIPPNLICIEPTLLIKGQKGDTNLAPWFAKVGKENREIGGGEEFLLQRGVLHHRSKESDGSEVLKVVVPRELREALVLLAYEGPMAGHLVVHKTLARLRGNFWWPGMAREVAELLKSCHTCQMVGKPNQTPPVAPLHPIPAVDPPFTRVLIDMVGPLPTTKAGHNYLLTIIDVTTRYPEAIPLKSTHTRVMLNALLNFFTYFGLPLKIQSDRGTSFTSKLFEKTMTE